MSEKEPKPKLSLLFNKARVRGEKRKAEETASTSTENVDKETGFGTRKHPRKAAEPVKTHHAGLQNPLQTTTDKTVFSSSKFSDLGISNKIIEVLQSPNVFHFSTPTVVQSHTIPLICKGNDVMVKSATGSGKTLSYLIPIVQILQSFPTQISRADGAYVIILVPTRELCVQIEETVKKLLLPFHWIVPTVICGGQKRKSEKARLRKGANILISTPGRLLDHALHTSTLSLARVHLMVLDEADRLLDMGFDQQLRSLLRLLQEQTTQPVQTILLSATLTPEIQQLANLALKSPVYVDVDQLREEPNPSTSEKSNSGDPTTYAKEGDPSTQEKTGDPKFQVPKQLRQYYVEVEANLRLPTLCAFLRKQLRQPGIHHCRILIFVNTCDSVAFHHELLQELEWPGDGLDPSVVQGTLAALHGNMPQHQRLATLRSFSRANFAVLLCTDVAARGLDLPTVDWIVQYDPPTELTEYVHRVGRTARAGRSGQSLLFLQPSEAQLLRVLRAQALQLAPLDGAAWFEASVRESGAGKRLVFARRSHAASEVQAAILRTVEASEGLRGLATVAFTSFCRAYATYAKELKGAFNVRSLHFGHVARSFGLREKPKQLGRKALGKAKRQALQLAEAVGEGSRQLDFGHTSEKKKRVFDLIKKEKEAKEKREKKRSGQVDSLRGKKKVEKLMSVKEWD